MEDQVLTCGALGGLPYAPPALDGLVPSPIRLTPVEFLFGLRPKEGRGGIRKVHHVK